MNPSIDDRINSALRALQTVILPSLPLDASLAREQVMLVMGHLQILQAQRDATPNYEAEELDDIRHMGRLIVEVASCGVSCLPARDALHAALQSSDQQPRVAAEEIRVAMNALLVVAGQGDNKNYFATLSQLILPLAQSRAKKDRRWFAPMGFDIELST